MTQCPRTHCNHGHEYNEANTAIRVRDGKPHYRCRKCDNARKAEWAKRNALARAAARRVKPATPVPDTLYRRELHAYLDRQAKRLAALKERMQ